MIPTVNRPQLLVRAVISALAQTLQPREIVVVQDGDCSGALDELQAVDDPRIVVTRPDAPSRDAGSTSRNTGIRAATSTWVAFLDDDDEWLPHKLRDQFAMINGLDPAHEVLVAGRVERQTEKETDVWPIRTIGIDERVGDYLFVRRAPGEGWLPTPTLLTRRRTALAHPFTEGIAVHEDLDWLLKLERSGVRFLVADSVVAVVHATSSDSLSTRSTWRQSLQWATDHRRELGPRAFSAFCLTEVSRTASAEPSWSTFATILSTSLSGRVRVRDVAQHVANMAIAGRLRERLRSRRRRRADRVTDPAGSAGR
nr:glycosyltransferase family 2 protein [Pseudonocardia sp. AL041005-10]